MATSWSPSSTSPLRAAEPSGTSFITYGHRSVRSQPKSMPVFFSSVAVRMRGSSIDRPGAWSAPRAISGGGLRAVSRIVAIAEQGIAVSRMMLALSWAPGRCREMLAVNERRSRPLRHVVLGDESPPRQPAATPPPTPTHPLDEATASWLTSCGIGPPVTDAEVRQRTLHGDEPDVTPAAAAEAWRLCDLAMAMQPPEEDDIFDESMLNGAAAANEARRRASRASRATLSAAGVCDEHLALPPDELLPLLHEMGFARIVGAVFHQLFR